MKTMTLAGKRLQTGTEMVPDADWWRGGVIYQVYPRSYQDTSGDGIGDLIQGGLVEWLISFGLDTIMNTLLAAIWPVEWIDRMGVLPAALVAGALFGAWWAGSRVWAARTDPSGGPNS